MSNENIKNMHLISKEDARKIHLSVTEPPEVQLDTNDRYLIKILLTNNSPIELMSTGDNPLLASYHWIDSNENIVVQDGIRSNLPASVLPSSDAVIGVKVQTPLQAGEYILRITLVQEFVRWFDVPDIGLKIDFPVNVAERSWWSSSEEADIVFGNISVLNKKKYRKYFQHQDKCRPLCLFVETCNICSLKCIICPSSMMSGNRQVMDEYLFEKTVSDYCDIGGGHLSLSPTRGEVFLDAYLLQRIEHINGKDLLRTVSFTTNAVDASRFCEKELSYIINSTSMIQISIYGLNEDEYSTMTRRKGYYEKMITNVKKIVKLNENSDIVLAFRLLKNHSQHIIEQWILGNFGHNLPYHYILEYMDWGGEMDTTKELPHDAKWLACTEKKDTPCYLPAVSTKVFVNGDVKFCTCIDYNNSTENTLGNIRNDRLVDIYNGERARELWSRGFSKCNKCIGSAYRPLTSIEDLYLANVLDEPTKYLGG